MLCSKLPLARAEFRLATYIKHLGKFLSAKGSSGKGGK
jgi:hypothetical protein